MHDIAASNMGQSPRDQPISADSTRRVAVDLTQRRIFVPTHGGVARQVTRLLLLTMDCSVLIGLASIIWISWPTMSIGSFCLAGLLMFPVIAMLYLFGAYRMESITRSISLKILVFSSLIGPIIAWALAIFFQRKLGVIYFSPPAAGVSLVVTIGFAVWVGSSRGLIRWALNRIESQAKILILGSREEALRIVGDLRKGGRRNPVVFVADQMDLGIEGEGGYSAAMEFCKPSGMYFHLKGVVKALIISGPFKSLPKDIQRNVVHARLMNIPVQTPCELYEEIWERVPVTYDDQSWFLHDQPLHGARSVIYLGIKRLADIAVASLMLAALWPVMVLTAIAVKISSPGPALFTQTRTGLHETPFTIYKFRTMRTDAEKNGAQWATKNDPRVTPLGAFMRKCRLDELPQLVNVIMGNMTLVGPRPERPEFNQKLEQIIPYYEVRHLVKPGLTGWAQVSYPYGASIDDAIAKLEYDVYYLKHASLMFDLRILMRTVMVVMGLRGR